MTYQELITKLISSPPKVLQQEILILDNEGNYWNVEDLKKYDEYEAPEPLEDDCSVLVLGNCVCSNNDNEVDDDSWEMNLFRDTHGKSDTDTL